MTGVPFPAGGMIGFFFSLHHCVQTSFKVLPTSYPMDTRGSDPGVK